MSEADHTQQEETAALAGDQTLSEDELRELASRLRKPEGAAGLETAEMMNATNLTMTMAAFDHLGAEADDRLLEIGFGNAGHVSQLLESVPMHYVGLDISESMVREATERNQSLVRAGVAAFHLGDGTILPFDDGSFERVFTVNTIYFWEDRQGYLDEIARVMAPAATLSIAYISPEFFEALPFTKYGFTKPDDADVETLAASAGLNVSAFAQHSDEVKGKDGVFRTRTFTVARLQKPTSN